MEAILLIDFGSTNTKVSAVDPDKEQFLGSAAAYTTVETGIGDGLACALDLLQKETGGLTIKKRLACSSAAGGLKMIVSGLVPSLTAEAAKLASLGAGAKLIKAYSYELTEEDITEIEKLRPDIFLLSGGVDGGNKDCILHNAGMLASCRADFPVILAGNRNAAGECEKLLTGREVIRCPNVLPSLGKLEVSPVQNEIRKLFLRRIIHAKGLSREQELISGILMPTPQAVLLAMELLAESIGDLVGVDPGGATTDVYSIAKGNPASDNVIRKGLIEGRSKRTVEGDIGMRYSAGGVVEAGGMEKIAALAETAAETAGAYIAMVEKNPGHLPQTSEEENIDYALASAAVETAVRRHAGTLEEVYTPTGKVFVQTGKDLSRVENLVLTGGALIHSKHAGKIAVHAFYDPLDPYSLRPKNPRVYRDKSYILAAMGLLAEDMPALSLSIMKKELEYGTAE